MRSERIFWLMIALAIGMIIGASRGALAQTGEEWARENPDLAAIIDLLVEVEDQVYELQQEVRALEQEVRALEQEVEDLQEVDLGFWYLSSATMWEIGDIIEAEDPAIAEKYFPWAESYLAWSCQHMSERHRQLMADDDLPCPEPVR